MNKQSYQSKKDAWIKKCLTAKALTQPQETLPIGDYTNIIRFDRTFNVVLRWMESYQMVIDANKYQIN